MMFADTAATLTYTLPASAYLQTGQVHGVPLVEPKPAPFKFVVRGGSNGAISNYATTEGENAFFPHLAKLKQIQNDAALWVDGAPPPSLTAFDNATFIIQQLKNDELPPTRIVASAEGGIAFCFLSSKKYADIECLNDGAILGLVSDEYDRPAAWEISPDPDGIAAAAARIRQFIEQQKTE